jgi:hypothetical protein
MRRGSRIESVNPIENSAELRIPSLNIDPSDLNFGTRDSEILAAEHAIDSEIIHSGLDQKAFLDDLFAG